MILVRDQDVDDLEALLRVALKIEVSPGFRRECARLLGQLKSARYGYAPVTGSSSTSGFSVNPAPGTDARNRCDTNLVITGDPSPSPAPGTSNSKGTGPLPGPPPTGLALFNPVAFDGDGRPLHGGNTCACGCGQRCGTCQFYSLECLQRFERGRGSRP